MVSSEAVLQFVFVASRIWRKGPCVAPWARGHGLAQMIVAEAEALAKTKGFLMINLDVRATQTRAIQSFEARGFSRYAVNEHYARVDGAYVTGYYFHKELK